uniref:Uncharacterized protein n=1 Tax=Anguilla anguilla TaxID=7936 RepID=A0A0E9SPT0_ANGAN
MGREGRVVTATPS